MDIASSALERLRIIAASVQAERRIPGLVVAASDRGHLIEHVSVGHGDLSAAVPAGPGVQYRIGSITKTVTAVAVMQLAAEGKVDLRGPLSQGWPGAPHDDVSVADLLTHGSGLQREPDGGIWETLRFPRRDQLAEVANQAARLYPQDSWFHYSNLGFALLGEMVAQITGMSWGEHVTSRILGPLGMDRTAERPQAPAAQGYSVEPYSDEVVPEPPVDCQGLAPAAQLWSTAEDLCRWSGLLSGNRPDVLDRETLVQMTGPRTIADVGHWSVGFGLGLMLMRDGETIYVGHTGSMPGFLAAVLCHPETGLGVVVLANTTGGVPVGALAVQLLGVLRAGVLRPEPWAPGEPPPEHLRPLLGRWWSEWSEWIFRWRGGHLEAVQADGPPGDGPTIFSELSRDSYLATNGPERGERLLVVRGEGDEAEEVAKLYWATYPFTRGPQPFRSPGSARPGEIPPGN
jgi:CubicO group peptidase (beta-lactamase class C family)